MIASMTKYSFILLSGTQNDLLERLQEIGLVDITRSAKPVDAASEELVADIELLDGLIQGLQKAEIPEGTVPEAIDGDIIRLAGGMLMRYADDSNDIKSLRKEVESLRIWGQFNPDLLQTLKEAGAPIHFHVLSTKAFKPEWADEYALSVIQADKSKTWFVVAGDDALPGEIAVPEADITEKEKELKEHEHHFQTVLSRLAGARERLEELEARKAEDYAKLDLHLAGAAAVPAAEDTIVTLVGYAPTEKDEEVTSALDNAGVFYLKNAAVVEDNPPISFKNNWFVRQFETLTDMYGRPSYDGFDPTPFISIFFLLFFAFCMGDAGYGLVLLLAGIFLKKVPSFKDMAPLVMILGGATVVIGFLFHTFFSMDISQWSIFEPIKGVFLPAKIGDNDATMILALGVGILHICLAMVVKTIHETRTKGFFASLGTRGWTLLIVGGVTVAALALAKVLLHHGLHLVHRSLQRSDFLLVIHRHVVVLRTGNERG